MKRKRLLLLSLLLVMIMTLFFAVPTYAAGPKISRTKHTMIEGQTFTLKVTGTKKTPVWTSSNKKIATVSKTGVVKAKKAGTVTIKAKVAGKTLKCKILIFAAEPPARIGQVPAGNSGDEITFTFHQNGWYVARLEIQVWDKAKQEFTWIYSESRAINQTANLKIDTSKYEVNRVGYQIWFFGWDNDYMNIPWCNTDFAKDFTLSGSGDYPEFTWR